MERIRDRRIFFVVCCFAMFAATAFFVLKSMDLFSGEYDDQMLPVIVYFTIQTNIIVAL